MSLSTARDVLSRTVADWIRHDAATMAAALAYYAVFSIAPLLLIAISVAGLVFGHQAAQGQVMAQLQGLLGPDSALAVEHLLQNASRPRDGLSAGLIGIVMLLLGASGVMGQLQTSLNRIWEVTAQHRGGVRGMLRDRFLSFTMVLGVGFLLLVSLLASAAMAAFGKYMSDRLPFGETLLHALNLAVSFGVITFLFALIFRYVPDIHVPWRDVWEGAAVTSLLFTIGKFAIGLYLGKSTLASSYGAAGSLVVLLVWVYYSAQILFFGAELTHVVATGRLVRPGAPAHEAQIEKERRRSRGRRTSDGCPTIVMH
jgi:membrane protein